MREIDASRVSLESFVSGLDIPLAKVEYRRVSPSNDTQVGLFGTYDNVKVESVKKKKKKLTTPKYATW
jgi:hypothetical protein